MNKRDLREKIRRQKIKKMQGFGLFKKIQKEYYFNEWKEISNEEVLKILARCIKEGMDNELLGSVVRCIYTENNAMYNEVFRLIKEDVNNG